MKSTDRIKELTAAGCELKKHNGGSHQIWWPPITGKRSRFRIPKRIYLLALSNPLKNGGDLIPALSGGLYVLLSGR